MDVDRAIAAGVDMLGFVFAPGPRHLSPGKAGDLVNKVPESILRVGLFLNPEAAAVSRILDRVSLDLLQFHGSENNSFCRSFGLPFVKAIAMGNATTLVDAAENYPDACGHLYDSHIPDQAGGTGNTFNWSLIKQGTHRIWLAGGLTPENVARAVGQVNPWAVDVSSGVEDAPGIKNHNLMKLFIDNAKSRNRSVQTI